MVLGARERESTMVGLLTRADCATTGNGQDCTGLLCAHCAARHPTRVHGALLGSAQGALGARELATSSGGDRLLPVRCSAAVQRGASHTLTTRLDYCRIATFVNRFQLTEQERKDIHDAIIERLRDREVEARELAAGALSSLLRGQSEEYVLSVAERCKTMAAQSLRLHKRAAESAEEFAERHSRAFVRRHAGVLGISAVIGLHPYDVPAWLPDLLALLASHGHDTSPIDVRSVMHFSCLPPIAC